MESTEFEDIARAAWELAEQHEHMGAYLDYYNHVLAAAPTSSW